MQYLHVLLSDSGFDINFAHKKVINLHNKKNEARPNNFARYLQLAGCRMVSSIQVMLQLPAFILPALPCVLEQPPPLPPRNELIHFQKTPRRPLPAAGTPGARVPSAFVGLQVPPGHRSSPLQVGQVPGERQQVDVRAGSRDRPGRSGGGVTAAADGAGSAGSLGGRSLSQLQADLKLPSCGLCRLDLFISL